MHVRKSVVRTSSALVLALASASTLVAQAPADTSSRGIHYKGITLTPIGFVAAEAVWRDRNQTADIGSSFNAIPFDGTTNSHLSEFRGSARQSRIALLGEGTRGTTRLSAFLESDFLSSGVTSNSNESDSYTLRIRQFWAQAQLAGGTSLAAGQMWSLLTTDKAGIAPRAEFFPQLIDAQYSVGFNWARQFGLRLTQQLAKGAWFAVAAEGAQTTFSNKGSANVPFLVGQAGGPLLNSTINYSTDVAPDGIAKLAFQPGFGHFELKAIGRVMRDRIVDVAGTNGGSRNVTTLAGGVGAAIVLPLPGVDFGVSGLYGKGVGRYAAGQLPDATVRANGTIAPITASSILIDLETHPTKKLDLYAHAGYEHANRTADVNAAGKGLGYGSALLDNSGCSTETAPTGPFSPGAATPCNADTKYLLQGNLGFWYRFYKGNAGTVQWGMQYSHTKRQAWDGLNGIAPQGHSNMLFTSFRYVLP